MTVPLQHTPTRPPREHQWRALERAHRKRSFFYRMEMGTGKSKVAIDEMIDFHLRGKIDRCLIVAGKGSYADWAAVHLPENVPEDVPVLFHLWTGAGTKSKRDTIDDFVTGPPVLRVLIMNVEGIGVSDRAFTVARNFVAGGMTLVVCDESTKIKNYDAQRTRAMIELSRLGVARRALTGSSVVRDPMDLWGQLAFLGLTHHWRDNIYVYKARYLRVMPIKVNRNNKMVNFRKVIGYKNLDELTRTLDAHSFRVLKEECLDLPPKIYQRQLVELTAEQRRHYGEMTRLALTQTESGELASAKNKLGVLQRLHQIVCGYIRDDEGNVHIIDTERLAALDSIIDETDGKVAVWCAYRHDVDSVLAHLRERYPDRTAVEYYGSTTAEQRAINREAFQNGDASFFVATAATGGYGLTLTACRTVVYYSNTFSLEHRIQSEDRFHRDGQTHPVSYVDLISRGTVEERIIRSLRAKKDVADEIEGDGFREWLRWAD